eukprot:7377876-Prymnesium_polylepis.1
MRQKWVGSELDNYDAHTRENFLRLRKSLILAAAVRRFELRGAHCRCRSAHASGVGLARSGITKSDEMSAFTTAAHLTGGRSEIPLERLPSGHQREDHRRSRAGAVLINVQVRGGLSAADPLSGPSMRRMAMDVSGEGSNMVGLCGWAGGWVGLTGATRTRCRAQLGAGQT